MKTSFHRTILFLSILAALLSGCGGPATYQWLKAPGWSRAVMLGNTRQPAPASLAVGGDGTVYVLAVRGEDGTDRPHIMALNRQAEIVWERTLDVRLSSIRQPKVFWDGQYVRLFWLSSQKLYSARLDPSGEVQGFPTMLSGEVEVHSFDLAYHPEIGVVVWFAGSRDVPGLYALPAASLAGPAVLIDEKGVQPALVFDEAGVLHAAWIRYPAGYERTNFMYGAYADGLYEAGREAEIYSTLVGPTNILEGPWLGIDREKAYVFWTISITTGMERGNVTTNYLHLPLGQPKQVSQREPVYMPSDSALDYQPAEETEANVGSWVLLDGEYEITSALNDLATSRVVIDELVVAFHSIVEHQFRKDRGQVSVAYFSGGQPAGYQLLSYSAADSTSPSLAIDNRKDLYVTWLERGELPGYQIYFASTAPDLRGALSKLTGGDLSRMFAESAFGLLSGIVLAPLAAFIWLAASLVVLGLTTPLRRGQGNAAAAGTVISLILALAAYWAVKISFLPGILTYVPFSAWIPVISPGLGSVLRIAVPVGIGLAALYTAYQLTYRRDSPAPLYFLLVYAAVDAVLTMAVYGVLLFAGL